MMHAYLFALEIEPVDVGKVYVALSLHCTVMPWFRSDKSPAEVLTAVRTVALATPPIKLLSGKPDMFGTAKDVPVNRIADTKAVTTLHIELYQALQSLGAIDSNSDWVGDGYMPHVTRQRSGRFEEGRHHTSRKLYLVEAQLPDSLQQKMIVSKLTLKDY